MNAIANTQLGSSSSAIIFSFIVRAKGTTMHWREFNITIGSAGDRWAMVQTNRHRYFRARDLVGICSPFNRSVASRARPSTSYIAFNASQSDNSRPFSCSTCCREYSSTYGCYTSNLKNKIGRFTNRCNSKETRTFPMKRMPYYCNNSAPLNHVLNA